MAVKRRKKKEVSSLPLDTVIEVIAKKKGKTPVKNIMTYGEALNLKPKNGWSYSNYQKGFSQFKTD